MTKLASAIIAIVRQHLPIDYYAYYTAEVAGQNADGSLELRPEDVRLPNSMSKVPITTGIPGVTVEVSKGDRCLVGFRGGDPSKKHVVGWIGVTPTTIKIEGSTRITIESPQIDLVESAGHPVPFGDRVKNLINGILTLLTTQSYVGNLGLPVAAATDLIGSNSYGSGGTVAVVTAMKAHTDYVSMNSTKVNVDS